jgi:hypothetical protein
MAGPTNIEPIILPQDGLSAVVSEATTVGGVARFSATKTKTGSRELRIDYKVIADAAATGAQRLALDLGFPQPPDEGNGIQDRNMVATYLWIKNAGDVGRVRIKGSAAASKTLEMEPGDLFVMSASAVPGTGQNGDPPFPGQKWDRSAINTFLQNLNNGNQNCPYFVVSNPDGPAPSRIQMLLVYDHNNNDVP